MQTLSSVQCSRGSLWERLLRKACPDLALLAVLVTAVAACSSTPAAETPDAGPRRKRDAGTTTSTTCLHCSMLTQLIAGGGIGGGGMNPCAGGGMGAPGGFTFCNEAVFTAFTGCMQNKCAQSCSFGMGMGGAEMCPPDGGVPPPPQDAGIDMDAGLASDGGMGVTCEVCVKTECAAEYAQCGADK